MDNASKALIMAGGILIGVMIISVALYIFTTARGVAYDANEQAKADAAASFNRYYMSFGSKITGLDALNIYNKAQDDIWRYNNNMSDYTIAISVAPGLISNLKKPEGIAIMNDEHSYSYEDTDKDGYIDSIVIN